MGLCLSYAFHADLHLREMNYSNGVTICADRGLDLFKPPCPDGTRPCRQSTILYFELSKEEVVKHGNVAAAVAREVRESLTNTLAEDLLHVQALLRVSEDEAIREKKDLRNSNE